MSSDNKSNKFAVYTDDSGVVISQEQYAELHGELISRRRGFGVFTRGTISYKSPAKKYKSPKKPTTTGIDQSKLIECLFCKARVNPKKYDRHVAKVHTNKGLPNKLKNEPTESMDSLNNFPATIEAADNSEQAKFVVCPTCSAQVKPSEYNFHVAKTHKKQLHANKKITYRVFDTQIKCSLCVFVGNRESIIKHMNEKHGLTESLINIVSAFEYRRSLKNKKQVIGSNNNTQTNRTDIKTNNKYVEKNLKVSNLIKCPLCDHKMGYTILFAHIQALHPEKNAKMVMAELNREYRERREQQENKKVESDLDSLVGEYEKLKQSHDEPRDGGKYLGHLRRENGKFGSLPLYDNYSDESDAE